MIAQSNVTHIVVGTDQDTALITDTRDTLVNGQIGVFKVGSATATGVNALAAGDRFQIVYKDSGGNIIESPVVSYSNIVSKVKVGTPVAATQRVVYIGFNGTSGSIDTANDETFTYQIRWFDSTKDFGRGKPNKPVQYASDSSATQAEIASGVAFQTNLNFRREKTLSTGVLKAEVVINNAGAVITGTGNLTATNGSKYVIAATDADAVVAVGDYLRLGTAAGAAVTDGAYKITSIDTVNNVITLEFPFQGASATYTEANCDYIAAATAASANCGVKISGLAQEFDKALKHYRYVDFQISLTQGYGATTYTVSSAPSKGIGTYEDIAETEWFLRGNRGEAWYGRQGNYPTSRDYNAVAGKTYQQIFISYKDLNAQGIDRDVASFGGILIATENESVGTPYTDLGTIFGV